MHILPECGRTNKNTKAGENQKGKMIFACLLLIMQIGPIRLHMETA